MTTASDSRRAAEPVTPSRDAGIGSTATASIGWRQALGEAVRPGGLAAVMPYAAAVGAALGAWSLLPVPLVLALSLALGCLWRPHPLLVLAVFAAFAAFFGSRAVNGLAEAPTGPLEGWVTLLDDPRPLGASGIRVTVRHGDDRIEARAYGRAAARLDDALAGERIQVSGTARAATGDWHRWRHVAATLTVHEVGATASAAPLPAFANRVRRLLGAGARSLSEDSRAMFTGMVFGDDREQSARLSDDFRAAGLGHLLVVSGQNVAFVLALASPLVSQLRPGVRLVSLLALLGVFALLTRFEPSVLRAVTMAAVAVLSASLGRPEAGRRTLAWAVAAVLVLDPFLVRSLAFQLSVCATAGLLWLTPALAEAMPGPVPLRLAVATTAGAQLAVTPLLIATFGTVPLASLPANVIAGPASGPVMMWGLTAGLGAGLLGGWAAWLIHRPTAVLLWWVRTAAAAAATAPPAMLGAGSAAVVCVGVALVLAARWLRAGRSPDRSAEAPPDDAVDDAARGSAARGSAATRSAATRVLAVSGAVAVAAALAHAALTAASPPPGWSQVPGAQIYRHGSVVAVILDKAGRPERLLESLRTAGVRRVDLIVAARGEAADAHAVLALKGRYSDAAVVAPPGHRVPGARTVRKGSILRAGPVSLEVLADEPGLDVQARASGRAAATADEPALDAQARISLWPMARGPPPLSSRDGPGPRGTCRSPIFAGHAAAGVADRSPLPLGSGFAVSVTLISGNDSVLTAEAVTRTVDKLLAGQDRSLALAQLDETALRNPEGGWHVAPLVDAAQTEPFLTARRVVVGRQLARFARSSDVEVLARLVKALPDTTDLVLVWERGVDPAMGDRLPKLPTALSAAVRAAGGEVTSADPPAHKADAHKWLKDHLSQSGLRFGPAAVAAVQDLVGTDQGNVVGIVRTLTGALGEGAAVSAEDVALYGGDAGAVVPWELDDAIDRGDISAALRVLHRLLPSRHPLQVLATLHSRYQRMLRLDGLRVADERQAAEILGMRGSTFPARKILGQTRRLGSEKVARAIRLLADADLALRGTLDWPDKLVLEVLVARLAALSSR